MRCSGAGARLNQECFKIQMRHTSRKVSMCLRRPDNSRSRIMDEESIKCEHPAAPEDGFGGGASSLRDIELWRLFMGE